MARRWSGPSRLHDNEENEENMTRDEFIRAVAERQGNSITETRYWVDIIFEELKRSVLEEENVSIYGFGTFSHRRQKSRRSADFNAKEYT